MLQNIRDNSQGVIAKVIVGFIIAIFALFGVESIIGGFITSPPVAEVNGEEISEAQLQANTQNLVATLGGNIEALDQELLEQISLNQLIEELVMRQLAQGASMSVSSDRIDRSIIQTPSFQINGVFDPDLAVRTMTSQGFSVPLYRETLREQMLMAQVANAYASSNFVTDAELNRLVKLSSQTRDLRYLSVTMGTRTLGTPIADEQIQSYYDDNQGLFEEDASVIVNYVLLDKNLISDEIALDQDTLLAKYEEDRSAFEGSAEKRASHILFEVSGDLTEAQALELAANASVRLAGGEEFGTVALELSSDTASAEEGGDIGFTDGSAFPPELEEALNELTLNEVSGPVITDFGVHLIKLTEDNENVYQSFEELSERLERELKSAEVEALFAQRLADLSNLAFETGGLTQISEELGLTVLQSQAFSRDGGNGLFATAAVIDAAFSEAVLSDGNNSEALELNDSQAMVLRLELFNEASILPLEEVAGEISVNIRTDMERAAATALGEGLYAALDDDTQLMQLLTENQLEWVDVAAVDRNGFSVNRQILAEVFAMPEPANGPERSSLTLDNGTFVIVELTQVTQGSVDSIPQEQRDSMINRMLSDLGNSDFQAFLGNLRESADIQSSMADDNF
ncbi:MAG: peptidyl-prolyl cis-trans isomerase D [Pseudohongiellaceae bacterium]|jgi:peptidyl-prolyl cis-trans isomerase D